MLWKLLKYDLRSVWKQFSILWVAMLFLPLIMFTGAFILLPLCLGFIVAVFILSMVYVVKRFYKGLLGDEGYLMHTLPVRTWQLVTSKLICAVLVPIANALILIFSYVLFTILSSPTIYWENILPPELWNALNQGLLFGPESILCLAECFLVVVVNLVFQATMAYQSMAIGHLFRRGRVAISVVVYMVLSRLCSWLSELTSYSDLFQRFLVTGDQSAVWTAIGLLAVPAVIFFFGTCYILKNRLNLE